LIFCVIFIIFAEEIEEINDFPFGVEHEVDNEQLKSLLDNLKEEEFILVKFYAKWCEFSKELAPVYSALPQVFPTNLTITSLDASKYSSLNYKFAIYGFPRILLFKGKDTVKKYHGNRTLDSISDFISRHTKLEPISGIEVLEVPIGRPTPEADIYLYLSSIFLLGVGIYSSWTLIASRNTQVEIQEENHQKED